MTTVTINTSQNDYQNKSGKSRWFASRIGSYFLRWLIGLIEINLTSGVVALLAILFN